MTGSTLEYATKNYTGHLRKALENIAAGRLSAVHFFMTTLSYRIMGICALLRQSDRTAFAAMLSKAGNARAEFLRLVSQGLNAPPKYVCASKNIGFSAALAAGDIDAARQIASLSPRSHFQDVEYEDDFLFFHFLHRILVEPEDAEELNRLAARWAIVLEGGTSGYLDVCRALLPGNGGDFEDGFDSLIQSRRRQLEEYKETVGFDEEMFAAEGKIYIEGLAVLRIAGMRGLSASGEYRLIPDIARVPQGTPLPSPEAWRTL